MSMWTWTLPLIVQALRKPEDFSPELAREAREMAAHEIERANGLTPPAVHSQGSSNLTPGRQEP